MKDCNQCGKCCIKYGNGGLSASTNEVAFWETFRPKISAYVSDGNIWISPDTGEQLERCPWLRQVPSRDKNSRDKNSQNNTSQGNPIQNNPILNKSSHIKYTCDIYYDRPDDCKHYPVTIEQMVADDCEMIEVRDLDNPKQAQLSLDKLMIDSRPSFS